MIFLYNLNDKTLRFPILKCLGARKKINVCLCVFLKKNLLKQTPLSVIKFNTVFLFTVYNLNYKRFLNFI